MAKTGKWAGRSVGALVVIGTAGLDLVGREGPLFASRDNVPGSLAFVAVLGLGGALAASGAAAGFRQRGKSGWASLCSLAGAAWCAFVAYEVLALPRTFFVHDQGTGLMLLCYGAALVALVAAWLVEDRLASGAGARSSGHARGR